MTRKARDVFIQITDTIRIVRFERGWQVERGRLAAKGKKAGQIHWAIFGYHADLAHACRSLVRCHFDELIPDATIDSLRSAARACEKAGEMVYNAARNHPGVDAPLPAESAPEGL